MKDSYEQFVDNYAEALATEPTPQKMIGSVPVGSTVGDMFREAMLGIRKKIGAISWWKWAGVAAAVLNGLLEGKTVAEIIRDVVELLSRGGL